MQLQFLISLLALASLGAAVPQKPAAAPQKPKAVPARSIRLELAPVDGVNVTLTVPVSGSVDSRGMAFGRGVNAALRNQPIRSVHVAGVGSGVGPIFGCDLLGAREQRLAVLYSVRGPEDFRRFVRFNPPTLIAAVECYSGPPS